MTRTTEGGGRMRKKERREQEGKRMFAQKAVRDSSQLPSPGDLPDLEIELESPMSPALAGRFFTTSATWEAHILCVCICKSVM